MVAPTGEILGSGGKTVKNVSGYDVSKLVVGSMGSLGIIGEVTFKLLPLPEKMETLLISFGSLSDVSSFTEHVFETQLLPASVDVMNREAYRPLSEQLKQEGLSALEAHWQKIFTLEEGAFRLSYDQDKLVLHVERCPAIHHMKAHGYLIADRFCEHTRIVNEEICHPAGYDCAVEYDQEAATCTQSFWKREG